MSEISERIIEIEVLEPCFIDGYGDLKIGQVIKVTPAHAEYLTLPHQTGFRLVLHPIKTAGAPSGEKAKTGKPDKSTGE